MEPKRIFIIEDDTVIRSLLEHMLRKDGYGTDSAADGDEALAKAASIPPADLILSDVQLPGMDGFEAARSLKRLAGWESVPVVMLSSRGEEQDIVDGLDKGAHDYLVKPFHPGELLARLRRLLR